MSVAAWQGMSTGSVTKRVTLSRNTSRQIMGSSFSMWLAPPPPPQCPYTKAAPGAQACTLCNWEGALTLTFGFIILGRFTTIISPAGSYTCTTTEVFLVNCVTVE